MSCLLFPKMNGADYSTGGKKNNDNQHPERSRAGRRAATGHAFAAGAVPAVRPTTSSAPRPVCHLSCVPKKGGAKEGHPAIILIRPARSSSVHFRNSGFALRQSEMLNPRTRSHDGNVRMGWKSTTLRAFTQNPHVPGVALHPHPGAGEILGHQSWPKEASRSADANCLCPEWGI